MKQLFRTWTTLEKGLLIASVVAAALFSVVPQADAMHIMEGYLPIGFCVTWGIVCLPFLVFGIVTLRKTVNNRQRALILLAMAGAFIFVISSLKIPSVTGSCSHMTGTGLSAILFGVPTTSVLGIIVLLFQAILLAHGGLTSLGANCFSMAIAGPIVSWLLFKAGKKAHLNEKVNVFIAAAVGDLFTYCITAFQLAIAYPAEAGGFAASFGKFLLVFAPTQLPLAIIEGLLTVLVIMALRSVAAPELEAIGFDSKQSVSTTDKGAVAHV